MITCNFSVVEDIVKIDETNYNYISDPTNFFTLTFNGEDIYQIKRKNIEDVYGKFIICWMSGVNNYYILLSPNKLIKLDGEDYVLCKYLVTHYDMIRELTDIEDVITFAYL